MSFIKEDYLLGNKKVIVGDKYHDLVLENLGRIYLRYGDSYKEFNAVIKALVSAGTGSSSARIIIEEDGISSDLSLYPNGALVFDAKSGILYLIHNGEALILVQWVNTNSSRYVLKTGDTMTGRLTINTPYAPLQVLSTDLNINLNADYLDGYHASAFARKNADETINGDWTFNGENTFNNRNTFNDTAVFNGHGDRAAIRVGTGDIITDGSMGSSVFVSGMNGTGWRLDADTNTLEIDNLIVRGVLNVFELVVNKVNATNGSFWVTDSFKVEKIHNLIKVDATSDPTADGNKVFDFNTDDYYIFYYKIGGSTHDTFFSAYDGQNSDLKTKNYAKLRIDSKDYATRVNNSNEPDQGVIDQNKPAVIYRWLFQILNLERFNEWKNSTPNWWQRLVEESTLLQLAGGDQYNQIDPIIDVSAVYQQGTEDIVDKEKDVDVQFDPYFDQHYFKIVNDVTLIGDNYYFDNKSKIINVNLYKRYFAGGELFLLETENDSYPVVRPGDILRCQKFTGQSVKQYHAIVCATVGSYGILIQKQLNNVLNRKAEYKYDADGKLVESNIEYDDNLYARSASIQKELREDQVENESEGYREDKETQLAKNASLANPEKGDALVRIGSIKEGTRRNSLYLTSSSNDSPYEDVITDVNRPDYTVSYFTPKFKTIDVMINVGDDKYEKLRGYVQSNEFKTKFEAGKAIYNQNPTGQNLSGNDQTNYNLYMMYKNCTRKIILPKNDSAVNGIQVVNEASEITKFVDIYLTYLPNNYLPAYADQDGNPLKVDTAINYTDESTNVGASYSLYSAPDLGYTIPVVENTKCQDNYTFDTPEVGKRFTLGKV